MHKAYRRWRRDSGGFFLFSVLLGAALLTLGSAALSPVSAQPDDKAVADAVENQLIWDEMVPADRIDVEVEDGIAVLKGRVRDILAKERATRIAEAVRGVAVVKNQIAVQPPPGRSDSRILRDARNALLMDPAADSFEISVDVKENRVKLTGTVESYQEKRLAEKVVKNVKGVVAVNNQIEVNYDQTRSESEIRTEVMEAMKWDVLVDHSLIDVEVNEATVELSGVVGSLAEKSRAIDDAWTSGVESVDASELHVRSWARDESMQTGLAGELTEPEMTEAVEHALFINPRVDAFDIEVEVEDRTVTLRGTVDSPAAEREAVKAARYIAGVRRVKNRLKVRPPERISDREIEENVRSAIERDPVVDRGDVTVTVDDGKVYLHGQVDGYYEKAKADDVASRVKGVENVVNRLVVDNLYEPYAYDPYVDDWPVYDFDWYGYQPGKTFKSDASIKEDIKDELFWSPLVDAEQVEVVVEDGVATLNGLVDSYTEARAARDNALEAGAVWVDNDLKVKSE